MTIMPFSFPSIFPYASLLVASLSSGGRPPFPKLWHLAISIMLTDIGGPHALPDGRTHNTGALARSLPCCPLGLAGEQLLKPCKMALFL